VKTAIAIDDWKRGAFERGLKDAGFSFDTKAFTKDGKTLTIFVECDDADFEKLSETVCRLQAECAAKKKSHN
jgi:hypothetical protein